MVDERILDRYAEHACLYRAIGQREEKLREYARKKSRGKTWLYDVILEERGFDALREKGDVLFTKMSVIDDVIRTAGTDREKMIHYLSERAARGMESLNSYGGTWFEQLKFRMAHEDIQECRNIIAILRS